LLNDQRVKEEIREEMKKFLGFKENENTNQNLCPKVKVYRHECIY
jgi:hypothetical protein